MRKWVKSRFIQLHGIQRVVAPVPGESLLRNVPEGRCDRSLARSAWDSATPKSRPVGYGVIRAGVRTDSMIGVTKFRMRKLKTFMLYVFWPTRLAIAIGVVPTGRACGHFATASLQELAAQHAERERVV